MFSSKDRKYNGNDGESYDEFVDQYLAASRDLWLSPAKRLEYIHNFFHGEALRFYNANIVGRAHEFSEALQMGKEQFNSASKQQQVNAELSKLSYGKYLGKTGGEKRKAFKNLKNHIEKRIPLCPGTWRHEIYKIRVLLDELVTDDWDNNTLSRVSASTSWRGLCTELYAALQIRIERESESRDTVGAATDLASKPLIFFTAPRYAKKVSKAMFPGSEYDNSCWNCGKLVTVTLNAFNLSTSR